MLVEAEAEPSLEPLRYLTLGTGDPTEASVAMEGLCYFLYTAELSGSSLVISNSL